MSTVRQETDLISVIIPIFNQAEYIGETLESLRAQTYTKWECLVIDDGSTDDSAKVIRSYSQADDRIRYYVRPEHIPKGGNACRNYGFSVSRGKFINWFDADDLMDCEFIEKKHRALLENTDAEFAVCRAQNFSVAESREWCDIHVIQSNNLIVDFLNYKLRFHTGGPLFRRNFLERLEHLFDERLVRHQEKEFFLRILLDNPPYCVVNQSLLFYRSHEGSITGTHRKNDSREKTHIDFTALLIQRRYIKKNRREYLRDDHVRGFFTGRFASLIIESAPSFTALKIYLVSIREMVGGELLSFHKILLRGMARAGLKYLRSISHQH